MSGGLSGNKQLGRTMLNTVVQQTRDDSGHQCVKCYNCLKVFAVASGNPGKKDKHRIQFQTQHVSGIS